MKKLILFFSGISAGLFAQAPDTTAMPESWKNESIVVLDYSYGFTLKFDGRHEEHIKAVYYLRDNWGLEEVSQIYLPADLNDPSQDPTRTGTSRSYSSNNKKTETINPDLVIGSVYKKDGSVIRIDASHLIPRRTKIDMNNTSGKKSLFSFNSKEGQKLAVPSLEVGDILEINYSTTRYDVPPVVPLINKFCTLNMKIRIATEQHSNAYGYNASPKPEPDIMNVDGVLIPESDNHNWTIERKNVDKFKEEVLNDDLNEIPYLIVAYKSPYGSLADFEFARMDEESMKSDQMARVNRIYDTDKGEAKSLAARINSLLLQKHPKIKDTIAYVNDAYYMYREIIGGEFVYAGYNNAGYKSDIFFVNVMSRLFAKRDVENKVFMSQEDHYGPARSKGDMIAPVYGIVIPHSGSYYFLFNPLYNLEPGNIPAYFEGQEYTSFTANKFYRSPKFRWWPMFLTAGIGLAVAPELVLVAALPGIVVGAVMKGVQNVRYRNRMKLDYTTGVFPNFEPGTNQISTDIVIHNIKTAGEPVLLETNHSFLGKPKLTELSKLNYYTDIYELEKNSYGELLRKKATPQTSEEKEEEEKAMKKIFTNDMEEDGFDVEKVTGYKFAQANFFNTKAPLVYSVNYKANNLVIEKENYIVMNVGKLIGEQLIITEDSTERTQDFYLPYQKQFTRKISIDIPEGYEVQNLEDLNVSKETPAGYFVAKANVENGKLVIQTKKAYAFKDYEKKKASDVYSFVMLAQQFRNKKLLLKKQA